MAICQRCDDLAKNKESMVDIDSLTELIALYA
jgi:hypothetical protein